MYFGCGKLSKTVWEMRGSTHCSETTERRASHLQVFCRLGFRRQQQNNATQTMKVIREEGTNNAWDVATSPVVNKIELIH